MKGIAREDLYGTHKGEMLLTGSFFPNGASAPVTVRGNWIESVAHTATGVWTITMKEKYRGWIGAHAALVSARFVALALTIVQLGAIDLAAGTIIVRAATESGGTLAAADIAADAANVIDILLSLKYERAADGSGLL